MLNIFVNNQQVGDVFRENKRSVRPDYFFGYKAPNGATLKAEQAISLTMPITRAQYVQHGALHPIFDMNLPEGELALYLKRHFQKAATHFDDLDFLEIIGRSTIGRLRFLAPENSSSEIPTQNMQELLAHDGAEGLFEHLLARFAEHSGISGAQPKVLICSDEELCSASPNPPNLDRITHKSATHIVKAWNEKTYPFLAENEFFCMSAARYAGLCVPNFALSNHGKFLIVERFDRHDLPQNNFLGLEDFCVLNGLLSNEKYAGSYENIAKRITQFVSPSEIKNALTQFFKSFALSCAVQNGDAHLKNFALIYDSPDDFSNEFSNEFSNVFSKTAAQNTIKFSPTFDIVSTTPYIAKDSLALTLSGSKRFPKKEVLSKFGSAHCGLSNAQIHALLEEVETGVLRAASELKAHIKERPEFAKIGQKMLIAWENGITHSLRAKKAK